MRRMSCPVCSKTLYYNFDTEFWEHTPIQRSGQNHFQKCDYKLKGKREI